MKHGNTFEFDVKSLNDSGEFSGYASTFNTTDLGGDAVVPGAFKKSLTRRPAPRVKMLLQHNTSEPIGVWTSLVEDRHGLKATGKLILDTVKGRETHALLKSGALDGLSIGFKTIADRYDRKKSVRLLDEVDLYEISIVTFGMNPEATVTAVKSDTPSRAFLRAIHQLNERLSK